MPERAKRPCNKAGCPQLTTDGYCPQHLKPNVDAETKRQYDRNRKSDPYRKLYKTAQWQRTRKAILARDLLCQIGKKCVERFGIRMPSTVVDHRIPTRDGGDQYGSDNLQGCCKACHDWKTSTENGGLGHRTNSTPERSN
jgi:5-methylcytosine-specific restriction protein A